MKSATKTEVMTHEIRFNTPVENRLRATFGGFYSDLQLDERNDFTYPGSTRVDGFGVQTGFSPNFPFTTGFTSDPGPFPDGVIFRNDIRRTDQQYGVFGELTFDFNEQFAPHPGRALVRHRGGLRRRRQLLVLQSVPARRERVRHRYQRPLQR